MGNIHLRIGLRRMPAGARVVLQRLAGVILAVWLAAPTMLEADSPPARAVAGISASDVARVQQAFLTEIKTRRNLPAAATAYYAGLLESALAGAGLEDDPGHWIVLVDRNPRSQLAMIYARTGPRSPWQWVGAAPASTGRPGEYDHFLTPTGVFDHSLTNVDFRAEGTLNENGIRGYGARGMRVFDFGWVEAERGWGKRGESEMRLQMHATDPARLESRLGRPASKGCIRIPAALNRLIDRYGLLDADYLAAASRGDELWVLRPDRTPVAVPGRYLVVVDSRLAPPATASRPVGSVVAHN